MRPCLPVIGIVVTFLALGPPPVALPAYFLSFGDYEVDGAERAGTGSSGAAWGGRVGLVVSF
jgi:hypothetical protein